MMLSGIPNLALALGYTNASWTLKFDLCSHYVCRLVNYTDEHDYQQAMPLEPDPSPPREPFIDFNSGYVVRAIHKFPKQGPHAPELSARRPPAEARGDSGRGHRVLACSLAGARPGARRLGRLDGGLIRPAKASASFFAARVGTGRRTLPKPWPSKVFEIVMRVAPSPAGSRS
jgi:hypothetical protein